MASTIEIAHRWANQDFGKNGSLTGSNTHFVGKSFYSYGTVIAQWLDTNKKIMAVLDVPLTNTTIRHLSDLRKAIPYDVKVLDFHSLYSGYSGFRNAEIITGTRGFDEAARSHMILTWLKQMREMLSEWSRSSSDEFKDRGMFLKYWGQINYLIETYHDRPDKDLMDLYNPMISALKNGENCEGVMQVVFGEEEYQKWYKRSQGSRTRAANKKKYDKLVKYVCSTCSLQRRDEFKKEYPYRKLSKIKPLQLFELKMAMIDWDERYKFRDPLKKHRNIKTFLSTGMKEGRYPLGNTYLTINSNNMTSYIDSRLIEEFELYKDKYQYRKRVQKIAWFKFLQNVYLYIRRKNPESLEGIALESYSYYSKREEKLKERDKKEEMRRHNLIQYYKSKGAEGARECWKKERVLILCDDTENLYRGGNVMLRFNRDHTKIETSKSVSFSINTAIKFFSIIKKWHENPQSFKRIEIQTQQGQYTISKYENDILTAGCHQIAWAEMEEMYEEIIQDGKVEADCI